MTKPKIEVIYHPEPTPSLDPLDPQGPQHPPTIGVRITTAEYQFGQWRPLTEPHTLQDVVTELATCCVMIACGQARDALGELPHEQVMRLLGVTKVAEVAE